MSKTRITNKTVLLTLEPDKFSIHTFELSMQLPFAEWNSIKKKLDKNHLIYEDENIKGLFHVNAYREHGIRITLICYEHTSGYKDYVINLIVNPRKLIDPKSSYIGILPPKNKSVDSLKSKFFDLFEGSVFENDIDSYMLKRVDLCTNVRCDNKKIFREIVRVIRKLPTPPKYNRKLSTKEDKKQRNKINKHTLRFSCGTHTLVIYDKTFQISDQGIKTDYETLPEGVLRFEVQYKRKMIRDLENETDTSKPSKLLWKLIQESENRMIKHFSQCIADVSFCQLEEILRRIDNSHYKPEDKDAMRKLAKMMQRKQNVDAALDEMEDLGYETNRVLSRFTKLSISPVPLWTSFCAEFIPGPVEIIKRIGEGSIKIHYIKKK